MPRKKVVTTEVVEETPPAPMREPDVDTGGDDDVFTTIDGLIDTTIGAEQAVVKVSRRLPDHGLEYCGQLPVAPEMDLEDLVQARWGGGRYLCQFWVRRPGERRRNPAGSVTVSIAGPPRDPNAPAVPVAAAHGNGGDVELRLQLARVEGKLEGLTAGGGKAEPLDPITMMEKFSAILANTRGSSPDPMAAITSIVGAVEKVVGVGREIAPERGGTDWGHVVDRMTDAIGTIIQENRRQQTPALVPPATGVERGPVLAAPASAHEEGPMWRQEIASWLPRLVDRAVADKDPAVAADVFLEDLSPATRKMLDALVTDDPQFAATVLNQLALVEPRIAELRAWFAEFLDAVAAGVAEELAGPQAEGVGESVPGPKVVA